MHEAYIELTKQHTDLVVDAVHPGIIEVQDVVEKSIKDWLV